MQLWPNNPFQKLEPQTQVSIYFLNLNVVVFIYLVIPVPYREKILINVYKENSLYGWKDMFYLYRTIEIQKTDLKHKGSGQNNDMICHTYGVSQPKLLTRTMHTVVENACWYSLSVSRLANTF